MWGATIEALLDGLGLTVDGWKATIKHDGLIKGLIKIIAPLLLRLVIIIAIIKVILYFIF